MSTYPSGQHFSVDVSLATVYGLNAAFLIHLLQKLLRFERDLRGYGSEDSRTWIRITYDELASHLSFLSYDQVRYAIDKLVDEGVLLRENRNSNKADKVLSYAFSEEAHFLPVISYNGGK